MALGVSVAVHFLLQFLGIHHKRTDSLVVLNNGIQQYGSLEERRVLKSVSLVKLQRLKSQLHAYGGFQYEVLVAFVGKKLHHEPAHVIDILGIHLLDKHLGVRLRFSLVLDGTTVALHREDDITEVIVAVVDKIRLEAWRIMAAAVCWREGYISRQLITALAFLCLRPEAYILGKVNHVGCRHANVLVLSLLHHGLHGAVATQQWCLGGFLFLVSARRLMTLAVL